MESEKVYFLAFGDPLESYKVKLNGEQYGELFSLLVKQFGYGKFEICNEDFYIPATFHQVVENLKHYELEAEYQKK